VGLCWAWAGSGECGGSIPWSHFLAIQIYQVFFSSTGNTNREKSERSKDACGIETMSEGKKGSWSCFIAPDGERESTPCACVFNATLHSRASSPLHFPSPHLFTLLATPFLPPHYTLLFSLLHFHFYFYFYFAFIYFKFNKIQIFPGMKNNLPQILLLVFLNDYFLGT